MLVSLVLMLLLILALILLLSLILLLVLVLMLSLILLLLLVLSLRLLDAKQKSTHCAGLDRFPPPQLTRLTSGFLSFLLPLLLLLLKTLLLTFSLLLSLKILLLTLSPQVLSSDLTAVTSGEPETPPLPHRSPPLQTTQDG